MKHLDFFLSLKCAGDVLNVVHPVKNPAKEITEAVSLIHSIRPVILRTPNNYNILDLCSGNGLIGVLSAFLLPVTHVVCIDKKERKRNWKLVKKFKYVTADINKFNPRVFIDNRTLILSCHPCGDIAKRIIDIYTYSSAAGLSIMPCCFNNTGKQDVLKYAKLKKLLHSKIDNYSIWCLYLSFLIDQYNKTCSKFTRDHYCLSPKNIIITNFRPTVEVNINIRTRTSE